MFYLLRRVDEKQFTLGDVVMVLADFSGVSAGTKGVVTEIYDEGVMVTWEREGNGANVIRRKIECNEPIMASRGWLSDGFSRDELVYLAVQTEKHPKV